MTAELKSGQRSTVIQTGLVGYGLSGKVFHAPFITAHPGFNLQSIASSGTEARIAFPSPTQVTSLSDLLLQPIDLVVICTPNSLHASQTLQALEAGKYVIIEKPFATSSKDARRISDAAKMAKKEVFPYHNRRFDSDFLTVQDIICRGYLGKILDYECHFDKYSPQITRARWKYSETDGGGTLFDLGTHLIDQALCLFGKPHSVFCLLYNQREDSVCDDSFELKLLYPDFVATLKAGVFVKESGPRITIHGTHGSFIKSGIDPQEAWLRKGKKPGLKGYGIEPKINRGILNSETESGTFRRKYETRTGNYLEFYNNVYNVIAKNEKPIVTLADAMLNLRIVEAAFQSSIEKRIITLD